MRTVDHFALYKQVTSDTATGLGPRMRLRLSGEEYLAAGPFNSGRAVTVSRYQRHRNGEVTLALAYPAEKVFVRLTVDAQSRIVREVLTSGEYLVTRTLVYDEPRSHEGAPVGDQPAAGAASSSAAMLRSPSFAEETSLPREDLWPLFNGGRPGSGDQTSRQWQIKGYRSQTRNGHTRGSWSSTAMPTRAFLPFARPPRSPGSGGRCNIPGRWRDGGGGSGVPGCGACRAGWVFVE